MDVSRLREDLIGKFFFDREWKNLSAKRARFPRPDLFGGRLSVSASLFPHLSSQVMKKFSTRKTE
jgi:hypothetical protein